MLTVRRGIARVGWVLLALWSACFAFVVIYSVVTQSPGGNLTQGTATFVGVPLAIFLLWRLLIWIGQGFWQHEATPMNVPAAKVFQLSPDFWTIRTMALLGAVLFAAYGVFGLRAEWALGGDYASRAVGSLVAYAAVGAIFGAVIARFLPARR
jgi:hypothetical protein